VKIGLFDPSLYDNKGTPSSNLGDLIIARSIENYFYEIFSPIEIIKISSHELPSKQSFKDLNDCEYVFIGGTNILSSNINSYNQWKVLRNKFNWLFSSTPISDVILFGVGWWQYQQKPTFNTKSFYKKALHNNFMHSVRDEYTLNKLKDIGIENVVNTSCPTTWELNSQQTNRVNGAANCLFTITDYMKDAKNDDLLLQTICDFFNERIYFFPQGNGDSEYIKSLDFFKKNKTKFTILNRTISEFEDCISNSNVDYIGTRLHAGINVLQLKKNALILAVDNRATEMAKDINLPVIDRRDFDSMRKWLKQEKIFKDIKIPTDNIKLWKEQFKK